MAPAPGLGVLLGLLALLGAPGGATRVLHSLRYQHVAVSEPGPELPQFMVIGYLDGIPFVRYDSERGRMEPQTPWMKDGPEPGYWDRETEISKSHQHVTAADLETLRGQYNQSRGLHTVHWVDGCDLLSDGSVRGSYRDGYDGWDFISFDPGSRSFVAADSAAQVTTRLWNGVNNYVEHWMDYVEHTCREDLQKYVRYGQEELERKGGGRIPVGIGDLGMEDLGTQ
ncbi:H-2 class I histocompatibility antigen, Q9 alpha chain-like [Malurus melanocephalus]|uniref:H-2 class I histocompatibility antigen, Q9 alpha chain-like n=1 Tax=Malurus melanocephalus TaxID=175006 RepID=UPI00254927A1|nr:H-2 class I histocompatibility antigen, Q9 alpha chain-like [Malurus melanocephalus]